MPCWLSDEDMTMLWTGLVNFCCHSGASPEVTPSMCPSFCRDASVWEIAAQTSIQGSDSPRTGLPAPAVSAIVQFLGQNSLLTALSLMHGSSSSSSSKWSSCIFLQLSGNAVNEQQRNVDNFSIHL